MIAINNSSCTSFPAGVEQVVIPCVKAFIKKERRLDYLQTNRDVWENAGILMERMTANECKSRAPRMEHSVRKYSEKLDVFIACYMKIFRCLNRTMRPVFQGNNVLSASTCGIRRPIYF